MASITTAKKIIEAGRHAGVSVWLWGVHGIGKSETVFQVTEKLGINFIDVRAALTESGDWMGLPIESTDKNGKKTAEFLMSSFLPQDPNWKGILFLDELNRARPDVLNCVFQLVLTGGIMNHYKLPKGACIVAAGNPGDDDYQVTDIEPALMSRFCHIDLTPTKDEWYAYAKEIGVRPDVVSFFRANPKLLDAKQKSFDFDSVKPNRRSAVMLARMVNSLEKLGYIDACMIDAASGLVGTAAAVQYDQFRKSNYLAIDVTKILKDYPSIREDVKKIVADGKLPEQKQAIEELFSKERFNDKEVSEDENQVVNLLTFMLDIAQDIAYVGADTLMQKCFATTEVIVNWSGKPDSPHHKVAKEFFDVITKLNKEEKKGKRK